MSVEPFAPALGRLPSGLFILTVATEAGGTGMLASWVQQSSFSPPQLTVAVKPERYVAGLLADGVPFALNQLAAGQTSLLSHFGRGFGPDEPAFDGIDVSMTSLGVPILSAVLSHLECRVVGRCSGGDHDLVIGRVEAGRIHDEAAPYVHLRKSGLNY